MHEKVCKAREGRHTATCSRPDHKIRHKLYFTHIFSLEKINIFVKVIMKIILFKNKNKIIILFLISSKFWTCFQALWNAIKPHKNYYYFKDLFTHKNINTYKWCSLNLFNYIFENSGFQKEREKYAKLCTNRRHWSLLNT